MSSAASGASYGGILRPVREGVFRHLRSFWTPTRDRVVLVLVGLAMVCLGASLVYVEPDTFWPNLWPILFTLAGLLSWVYAWQWERALPWVRETSGTLVVTATASRAVALLTSVLADESNLSDARAALGITVWSLASMLLLWGWVRVLPTAYRDRSG